MRRWESNTCSWRETMLHLEHEDSVSWLYCVYYVVETNVKLKLYWHNGAVARVLLKKEKKSFNFAE